VRFGFCGATYQGQSLNFDAERAVNLYPTPIESSGGKTSMALVCSPGLKAIYNLGATSILGIYCNQPGGSSGDRLFGVVQNGVNQVLYEMFADGSKVQRGQLNAPTTAQITFADNGKQLVICTGGQLWLFDMSTNALPTQVGPGGSPSIAQIVYSDGFFVALQSQSNKFYASALLDGTTWPALSVGQVSEFPDNVVSIIVNQRLIYFFGRKASIPYQNVGALNMPFLPIPGVFVENGCGAILSPVKLDNSVFWLDLDERGAAIARRNAGITPQRVSNHSVEGIWQNYPKVSDAISYAFQDQGHSFWHIYFPSGTSVDGIQGAGASWRYDVETGFWHEVAFWNEAMGHYEAHHSQNHAFAFGKHFVGDRKSGTIYQMAIPSRSGTAWQFADDAGSPIRRLRRGPTISTENQYFDIPQIEFDLEGGLGPQPPLIGVLPPTILTLADSAGAVSAVGVDDLGELNSTAGSVSSPQTIILNDPQNLTSWKLGIEAGGPRGIVKLQTVGNYPSNYRMISNTGTRIWNLQISKLGVLQTSSGGLVTRGPQLMYRHSKDHAHTWSDYEQLDCGQAGDFNIRVIRRRIGRARNYTPEISWTDPVPLRIVDAYIPPATERLAKQIAKMA
jgi:hypothetical protein